MVVAKRMLKDFEARPAMSLPIDQARPVRDGEHLDATRLGDYLMAHLPDAKVPFSSSSSRTGIRT